MLIETNSETKNTEIRHKKDPETGLIYISIVDVIEMLGISTDSRNYWKTLKNRLNKGRNELVTRCNQLKMRASDGKMYLTDATDADTLLLLVQQIAPSHVGKFRKIFKNLETMSSSRDTVDVSHGSKLSTQESDDYELSIDAYETNDAIFIHAMLAGVEPDNISIVADCSNIVIKGKRKTPSRDEDSYYLRELSWGNFSRELSLPSEVEIDEIETKFSHGLLEIKLPKIDKTRTKIIRVKNS